MQTKNKKIDNAPPPLTPKSRCTIFTPTSKKGFTLIELLVVISIIALLSTIVLGMLNDGRVKARNTAKNSLVLEYIKALELYRSNNSSYPSAGSTEETIPRCIGLLSSETCRVSLNRIGDTEINNALNTYIPGPPASKNQFSGSSVTYSGVTYECLSTTCSEYKLDWVLEKTNARCIRDSIPTPVYDGHTRCQYSTK